MSAHARKTQALSEEAFSLAKSLGPTPLKDCVRPLAEGRVFAFDVYGDDKAELRTQNPNMGKPTGGRELTWAEFVRWNQRIARSAGVKGSISITNVVGFSPSGFEKYGGDGINRRDDAAGEIQFMFFDCDDAGEWAGLKGAFKEAGLSAIFHQSSSGRSTSWHVVIPVFPFQTQRFPEDQAGDKPEIPYKWRYHHAAGVLSALAGFAGGSGKGVGFDTGADQPLQLRHVGSRLDNSQPPRQVETTEGGCLDFEAFVSAYGFKEEEYARVAGVFGSKPKSVEKKTPKSKQPLQGLPPSSSGYPLLTRAIAGSFEGVTERHKLRMAYSRWLLQHGIPARAAIGILAAATGNPQDAKDQVEYTQRKMRQDGKTWGRPYLIRTLGTSTMAQVAYALWLDTQRRHSLLDLTERAALDWDARGSVQPSTFRRGAGELLRAVPEGFEEVARKSIRRALACGSIELAMECDRHGPAGVRRMWCENLMCRRCAVVRFRTYRETAVGLIEAAMESEAERWCAVRASGRPCSDAVGPDGCHVLEVFPEGATYKEVADFKRSNQEGYHFGGRWVLIPLGPDLWSARWLSFVPNAQDYFRRYAAEYPGWTSWSTTRPEVVADAILAGPIMAHVVQRDMIEREDPRVWEWLRDYRRKRWTTSGKSDLHTIPWPTRERVRARSLELRDPPEEGHVCDETCREEKCLTYHAWDRDTGRRLNTYHYHPPSYDTAVDLIEGWLHPDQYVPLIQQHEHEISRAEEARARRQVPE